VGVQESESVRIEKKTTGDTRTRGPKKSKTAGGGIFEMTTAGKEACERHPRTQGEKMAQGSEGKSLNSLSRRKGKREEQVGRPPLPRGREGATAFSSVRRARPEVESTG